MEIGITNIIDLIRIHFKEKYQEIQEKHKDNSVESKIDINLELLNYINSIKEKDMDNYRIIMGLMAADFYKEIKYKELKKIQVNDMKQAIFEMYDSFYDIDDFIQLTEENSSVMIYLLASFISFKSLDNEMKKEIYDSLDEEDIEKLKKFGKEFLIDMKFVKCIDSAEPHKKGTI